MERYVRIGKYDFDRAVDFGNDVVLPFSFFNKDNCEDACFLFEDFDTAAFWGDKEEGIVVPDYSDLLGGIEDMEDEGEAPKLDVWSLITDEGLGYPYDGDFRSIHRYRELVGFLYHFFTGETMTPAAEAELLPEALGQKYITPRCAQVIAQTAAQQIFYGECQTNFLRNIGAFRPAGGIFGSAVLPVIAAAAQAKKTAVPSYLRDEPFHLVRGRKMVDLLTPDRALEEGKRLGNFMEKAVFEGGPEPEDPEEKANAAMQRKRREAKGRSKETMQKGTDRNPLPAFAEKEAEQNRQAERRSTEENEQNRLLHDVLTLRRDVAKRLEEMRRAGAPEYAKWKGWYDELLFESTATLSIQYAPEALKDIYEEFRNLKEKIAQISAQNV